MAYRHQFGSWGHPWGIYIPSPYPTNIDVVPMLLADLHTPIAPAATISAAATRTPHNYWILFNECEHDRQCNTPPEIAAQIYYEDVVGMMLGPGGADPNAKLIIGGVNASPCGLLWLQQFVESYRANYGDELYNAGWHFHLYPEIVPTTWPDPNHPEGETGCNTWDFVPLTPSPAPVWWGRPERLSSQNWVIDARSALGFVWQYGKPTDEVWFTEMGCLIPDCELRVGFMSEYVADFTEWLNDEGRWVTRYAWFTDVSTVFFYTALYKDASGFDESNRTALGDYYALTSAQVAGSVPLPWPSDFVYLPFVGQIP
jgi:hypothetical protein